MLLVQLLNYLRAPCFVWTSALSLYDDFAMADDFHQSQLASSGVNVPLILLYRNQINAKEGEFHAFCAAHGLPERDAIDEHLLSVLGLEIRSDGNRFPGSGCYSPESHEKWLTEEACQMRHPWFCLLEPKERDFIRNADTAFATCLTCDFSIACSQWWRCIESVLRRRLIGPLGEVIDRNPTWRTSDLKNAALAEKESVFVQHLAVPTRRDRISLGQMLIILEKCISDYRATKASKSMVRRNCVRYVTEAMWQFRWVSGELDGVADFRSVMTPRLLTGEAIASFRNATSHDQPMDFVTAAVGRLIAIRILDFMHYPRYCVDKKLEELKREVSTGRAEKSA